jgi:hypothetical protein
MRLKEFILENKIKGADGKACWDGYRYNGTTDGKDSCVKVGENFNGEYDDEAGMAHTNLHTIARAAQGLLDTIDDQENLPEWVQEKIAKVEGMMVTAWNYLKSQEEQGIDPRQELDEFAPAGRDGDGDSGRWYTDDELADIIGDDWFEDFDVSNDGFNIDTRGEKAKQNLVGYANSWFDDKGYNVIVMGVDHNEVDHDLKWYIVGSFHNPGFADKDLNELSFLGSQCTKDCSGHRAGYNWYKQKGRDPLSHSQSFNNGAGLAKAGK